jgi:hypothetical protein
MQDMPFPLLFPRKEDLSTDLRQDRRLTTNGETPQTRPEPVIPLPILLPKPILANLLMFCTFFFLREMVAAKVTVILYSLLVRCI